MHADYPQRIFEIGDVVLIDEKRETKTRNVRKIACVITDNVVGYEEIASVLDAFFRNLGVEYEIRKTEHPSFIEGRDGTIIVGNKEIGIIGEIHPQVLNNWKLEKPVIGFEVFVDSLFHSLNS